MAAAHEELVDRTRQIVSETGLEWKKAWRQAELELGHPPKRRITIVGKALIGLGALVGGSVLLLLGASLDSLDGPPTTLSAEALALDAALMDVASTFSILDAAWAVEKVPYGVNGIGLRLGPDLEESGTWLVLAVRSLPSDQTQQERFLAELEGTLLPNGELTSGPAAVSVDGVDGYRGVISDIEGNRTGQPLGVAFAVLFDEQCDYVVMAQWELSDEAPMREYFDYVLDQLRLPTECLTESL